ncbi:unnamed protein product [Rotaria sp. Silwood2]|nr:unnamed protein product [Rotaria sp. Silwood2]CAF4713266.1 unnamed protein product [Rotaria sp. Silwood2]
MNTCNTLKLTDLSVIGPQHSPKRQKPTTFARKSRLKSSSTSSLFIKQELSLSASTNRYIISQLILIISDTADSLELEEIQ